MRNQATNEEQRKAIDRLLDKKIVFAEDEGLKCCGIFPVNDCSDCSHFKQLKYKTMNREENIKDAYGDHWELAKQCGVDAFGFIDASINGNFVEWKKRIIQNFHGVEIIFKRTSVLWSFRPKSLARIEDNNGC